MNNSEAWGHYKEYTKDLNEFSRKLSFAGSAICWALKDNNGVFPKFALIGLAFFVFFFIADVIHKLVGAYFHRKWIRDREIELFNETNSIEGVYLKPERLDKIPWILFIVKIVLLLIGFICLGVAIFIK